MMRFFLLLAALAGLTGVALGAFAAHGLKAVLLPEQLAVFQTAVHYQLIHGLALFGVALLLQRGAGRLVQAAGVLFALGILLFSGSLYALLLSGLGRLGLITPLGGLCFMAGWLCLVLQAGRRPQGD